MRRFLLPSLALVTLAGCPTYDRYSHLENQGGLTGADQWSKYGAEEAQKIAIGRKLAQGGGGAADYVPRMEAAIAYAKTLPDVVEVTGDPQTYFLNVTFRSGWRAAVLPVNDGKAPEETPGLPAAKR